jgi:hypothetical protein
LLKRVYRSNETFILWYASMQVSIQSLENRRRPIQPATINGLGPQNPLCFRVAATKARALVHRLVRLFSKACCGRAIDAML